MSEQTYTVIGTIPRFEDYDHTDHPLCTCDAMRVRMERRRGTNGKLFGIVRCAKCGGVVDKWEKPELSTDPDGWAKWMKMFA